MTLAGVVSPRRKMSTKMNSTRDTSSEVPVNYDTRRYINSLVGMIYLLTIYLKVSFTLIYCGMTLYYMNAFLYDLDDTT